MLPTKAWQIRDHPILGDWVLEAVRGKLGKPELEKKLYALSFPGVLISVLLRRGDKSNSPSHIALRTVLGGQGTLQCCQSHPSNLYVLVLGWGLGLLLGVPWLCQTADKKDNINLRIVHYLSQSNQSIRS